MDKTTFDGMSNDAFMGYVLGLNKAFHVVTQIDIKSSSGEISDALRAIHKLSNDALAYMESHPERFAR